VQDDRSIVEAAVPAEEVYDGQYLGRAPDIMLRQAPGVHIEGVIGRDRDPFESPSRWRGENKEIGLFVAHGPDIDSDAALEGMHILDVAPTVLHHTNTAVPTNLDGEVRTDLFAGGSEPASRDTVSQPPVGNKIDSVGDTEREVSDRLSDLGYLQ
jgi:predicted AlkP superfamily phosphohydrolase/phosphomutase